MKIKFLVLFVPLILKVMTTTHAQSIGMGSSINYASNGINLFYSHNSKNGKWQLEPGNRIAVNTFALNNNEENYIFYQTGYAHTLLEHLGINLKANRKIAGYKWLRLDATANLLAGYHSLLFNTNYKDPNTNSIVATEVIYWKPAPVVEITAGLSLQAQVSPAITLSAYGGVGYAYFHHQYESGWNKTQNRPTAWVRNGLKPDKDRGSSEFIGLDGLPTLSLAVKYTIKPPQARNKR